MKVKALKSFVGKICMSAGEIREIVDEKLAKDLLAAGHVVEEKVQKDTNKTARPATSKLKK